MNHVFLLLKARWEGCDFALSPELTVCTLEHPVYTGPLRRDGSGHREMIVDFPMDAVAGTRRTLGRLKNGGVPLKPPATTLLSLWPSAFWDFGSLHQRRSGVISYALLRQPYLRPHRCGDLGFVSRHMPAEHRIPDVLAAPDVEASCITSCRGRRVSFSARRCGVTVCLQSRRRRWDYLVLPKDGHTSVSTLASRRHWLRQVVAATSCA